MKGLVDIVTFNNEIANGHRERAGGLLDPKERLNALQAQRQSLDRAINAYMDNPEFLNAHLYHEVNSCIALMSMRDGVKDKIRKTNRQIKRAERGK